MVAVPYVHESDDALSQNPLHTFPRNFPVDGEAANLLREQVVAMEFEKRHDTTDTTDFCPRQRVTDLLYGETGVMDFGLYRVLTV